jgi:copper(I)-binding protein
LSVVGTFETIRSRLLRWRFAHRSGCERSAYEKPENGKPVMEILAKRFVTVVCALSCMLAGTALALDVVVSDAWTRATAPGQTVAGIYFDIESDGDAALVGVETGITDVAELHFMKMEDGVMRMRPVPKVDLPAGETVKFAPGGLHVMLFELKQPLEPGSAVGLSLLVEDGSGRQSRVNVSAEVRHFDGSKAHHH